jgi:hypothetical protein
MNIKIAIIPLFTLFVLNITFAQKVVYIDENMQEINAETYSEKCEHVLLKCLIYNTNSLKIHKVLFKYKFGTTNKKTVKQIIDLAGEQLGKSIDTSQNLLIYYHDTLYSFDARVNQLKYFEQIDSIVFKYPTKKMYDKQVAKTRLSIIKKTNTYSKKHQTALLHFYNFDFGTVYKTSQPILIKDNGLLKSHFFDAIYNYGYVILKPNGSYFLSGGDFRKKNLNLLLKNDDWSNFISDWEKTYTKFNKKGVGIFKPKKTF